MRRAHNHDVTGHHGRRVQADFAGVQVDLLVVVKLQIHDAVLVPKLGTGIRSWRSSAISR